MINFYALNLQSDKVKVIAQVYFPPTLYFCTSYVVVSVYKDNNEFFSYNKSLKSVSLYELKMSLLF